MLKALEKFIKYQNSHDYEVRYIDTKDKKVFTTEIKSQIEKYMSDLNDYHKKLVHSEFVALGLDFDMPDEIDWDWYDKHAHVYALFYNNSIIGICTCGTYKTGRRAKHVCYIMELIVDEAYRGKGLGTHLLTQTVQDCKKHEPYISRVMIDVYDANVASMKSYLNQGFKPFRHTLYKSI